MKVTNFQGGNIYTYEIVFSDGGSIKINTDTNGNIINYDVVINGKLVKNYTKPYTEIPDNEVIADIYKATNGIFDWKKTSIGFMTGGDGREGFIYQIKSNLTAYEVIYNNLPAVEVTAKAPAKKGTKDFFSKKILGVPVWFVLLGVVGWTVFFTDRAKIKRKR